MKTAKKETEQQPDPVVKQVETSAQQNVQDDQNEANKKNKKKHNSALIAAEKGRSAIGRMDHHADRDIDFGHTGTNFDYR